MNNIGTVEEIVIPRQMDDLSHALDVLLQTVETIGNRLNAVMVSANTCHGEKELQKDAVVPEMSEMASQIMRHRKEIQSITDKLKDMISRLEV